MFRQPGCIVLLLITPFASVMADEWVFEPSVSLDQRFDDNYSINPDNPDPLTATRLVGNLGMVQETPSSSIRAVLRFDGLLRQDDEDSAALSSNQILFIESEFRRARSSFGIGLNIKQDTPSRDISADVTDLTETASDTGASVTQSSEVGRRRLIIDPTWTYEVSRRTTMEAGVDVTLVEHDLPDPIDAIARQFVLANPDTPLPDDLSIDSVGTPFTVNDELDDYKEAAFKFGWRYKLSQIVTLTTNIGYRYYVSDTEADPSVIFPFEDKEEDPNERLILRNPKRQSVSNTTTFRLGYERLLSPTLKIGLEGGIYSSETDDTDLLREDDQTGLPPEEFEQKLNERIRTEDGWLASVNAAKDAGVTRYSSRLAVDVLPSDIGSQVESLQLVGDVTRELNPRLHFSFKARAYEPDALNSTGDDEFARRFLSVEPKLTWQYNRAWTVAAAYRYRRQKSQTASESGASNAVLFSLKYTPPSAIRDAANRR
ncbi:MAG: hypothetical protein V3U76_11965 [Granulosicoccus sp.]